MTESPIFLRDSTTGRLTEAVLFDGVDESHVQMWESQWVPQMQAYRRDRPFLDRPEDSHWDWRRKFFSASGLLGYRAFVVVCGEGLQGMMLVNEVGICRLGSQLGKPLVYVKFVATAPWNRSELVTVPRFRGVGKVLMLAAIEASREAGYRGRIGLHSLPAAEHFYEGKCGMSRLGADAAQQNLVYFEMTEKQADSFCGNERKS